MKSPFPILLGLLAIAGLVAANPQPVLNQSPYTQLPVERTDGIQVDFPYPIYLSDERFSYDVTITNTTTRPFALSEHWSLGGEQLIWIPLRNGREIIFQGRTGFGGDARDFDRSPLQVLDSNQLRLWAFFSKDYGTLQPGQTKVIRTRNGGMFPGMNHLPDSLVPYLLATDRLLVGPPVSIRVDPRKVRDFPVVITEGDAHTNGRTFHEVEIEGERFIFTDFGYRLCRLPKGLKYNVKLSLDEVPKETGGSWTRRTMTVSFPGSNEPDYIGVLQDSETWSGTAQTNPKLWAKRLPAR